MSRIGSMQFVLPLANTISKEFVDDIISRYAVQISVIPDAMYDVLYASDLAIAVSGTATLEAALAETPMIVIYKISLLSYLIGRILIKVKNIGLVNIIAGKTVVPELIQAEANPDRIAELAHAILFNKMKRKTMELELKKIKELLGSPGAADKAARLVYSLLS
jgi:lipid-A-disaccharide synthase